MIIKRLHSFKEYQKHRLLMASEYQHRREYEKALQENKHGAFEVAGFSCPAGEKVNFLVDFYKAQKHK